MSDKISKLQANDAKADQRPGEPDKGAKSQSPPNQPDAADAAKQDVKKAVSAIFEYLESLRTEATAAQIANRLGLPQQVTEHALFILKQNRCVKLMLSPVSIARTGQPTEVYKISRTGQQILSKRR